MHLGSRDAIARGQAISVSMQSQKNENCSRSRRDDVLYMVNIAGNTLKGYQWLVTIFYVMGLCFHCDPCKIPSDKTDSESFSPKLPMSSSYPNVIAFYVTIPTQLCQIQTVVKLYCVCPNIIGDAPCLNRGSDGGP